MGGKFSRAFVALALAVGLAVLVSACGSGGSSDTGGKGITAESGSRAEEAAELGEKAAEEAGGQASLPANKTVGFVQIVGGIESADRIAEATKSAFESVGWKFTLCDGEGIPTKQVTCANSLISQGVDVLVTTGIDPSVLATPLREAKKKGIPFIAVGGGVPPGYTGNYAPDESKIGALLADYVGEQLEALPEEPVQIAVEKFPAPWAEERTEQLESTVAASGGKLKIAATQTTDAANLVAGTQQATKDELTQNPDLKAFWASFDSAGQVIGQQVQSQFPGKEFPDRPMVATFHGDLGTLELMRQGAIDVIADVDYDASGWIGADQVFEYFARQKEPSQELEPSYPGVGDLYTYKIVTKENLPPKGQYVKPATDFVTFFQSKWKAEFGR